VDIPVTDIVDIQEMDVHVKYIVDVQWMSMCRRSVDVQCISITWISIKCMSMSSIEWTFNGYQ